MPTQLHLLNAGGQLEKHCSRVKGCFVERFVAVKKLLDIQNVDVVVYVDPQMTIPELGVGGRACSRDRILIAINPSHPNFDVGFEDAFSRTLAHELHHCARWSNPGYGHTLAEALITEGLACAFEVEICGGEPSFYACALSHAQLTDISALIAPELENHPYDHAAWFFGNVHKGIPRHAGYSIGYDLVSKYRARHGEQASQLVNKPASAFFEMDAMQQM